MISKSVVLRAIFALAVVAALAAPSALLSSSVAVATGKASGAPITVGVECTCSGPFGSDIADWSDAYKAWADTVNSSGGLEGHKIKIIEEDDAATPSKSTTQVKTLLSDHLDAFVSMSLLTAVWAATVVSSGIPVVGVGASTTLFSKYPTFFTPTQSNASATYSVMYTAKLAGAKNLGYLYCAAAAVCAQDLPKYQAAGSKVGVPVVYSSKIATTAPNFTAQCLAAQEDHVSSLLIGSSGSVVAEVGTDCSEQNYYPIYVTQGLGFTPSEGLAPGLSKNGWAEYDDVPYFSNIPAIKRMNAAVNKYFPGIRTNKTVWNEGAVSGWASGVLLQTGVAHSGMTASTTPSSKAIINGLDKLRNDTLDGLAPPLTFKAGQANHATCWYTAHEVDGKLTRANGGKYTCD